MVKWLKRKNGQSGEDEAQEWVIGLKPFIYKEDDNQRLDVFLTTCLPEFSRSRIQGLIKDGFVKVEAETVTKAGRALESGEQIEIRIPPADPKRAGGRRYPARLLFLRTRIWWW